MNLEEASDDKPKDPEAKNLEDQADSQKEGGSVGSGDDQPFTWCSALMYFGFRILIVVIIVIIAFLIPNITILLTLGGAILGTIVNILLPVLFYNRAYAFTNKNRELEVDLAAKEASEKGVSQNDGVNRSEGDPRWLTKFCSWVVLFLGVCIGIVGVVYVVIELSSGKAEHDSA